MNEFTRVPATGLDISGQPSTEANSAWMHDQRVLVLAGDQHENEFLCSVLDELGMPAKPSADIAALCKEIEAGAGLAVVEGSLLNDETWNQLRKIFQRQPAWADFPLLVLAADKEVEKCSALMDEASANVLLLERPYKLPTLLNAVRGGLRSHRRQCEMGFQLSKSARRQETLRVREDLLRERNFSDVAINSLPGMFYALDDQGRFLRWNRELELVSGYSTDEVAKMHPLHFFPPAHRALIAERIREVFKSGEATADAPLLTKSGAQIPYFFTGKRCYVDGRLCLFGMGVDVSEQKQTEERLREAGERLGRHAEELERRVAERTRSLQTSVQSLEGVLYHVAHDLRAPLRTMQGFTTILLEECSALGEDGADYARRIAQASSRMDKLIHDLLAYGRLAHVPLKPAQLDLDRQLQSALVQFHKEIESRKAVVKVENPLLEVYADPALLGLVLANLLSNALNFIAPTVFPEIKIRTERMDAATVRFSVQDNGIGIAPEHQERIFRVFERLQTDGVSDGTGIGLAIVKKSVERMGGTVGVESNLGAGSRFWLDLPSQQNIE